METLSSRKNAYIRHVRALAADGAYRRERGEYLCDGLKTLREALRFGAYKCTILLLFLGILHGSKDSGRQKPRPLFFLRLHEGGALGVHALIDGIVDVLAVALEGAAREAQHHPARGLEDLKADAVAHKAVARIGG